MFVIPEDKKDLRDQIAIGVMDEILTSFDLDCFAESKNLPEKIADVSYRMADAMIARSKKVKK